MDCCRSCDREKPAKKDQWQSEESTYLGERAVAGWLLECEEAGAVFIGKDECQFGEEVARVEIGPWNDWGAGLLMIVA
jgi:hypothetical protein